MRIAVIGAGYGGMAAAYDFRNAGHSVRIFEAADHVGGLAAGFKEPHWKSSVEKFYHHWFKCDHAMLGWMEEMGLEEKVFFKQPKTVMHHKEKFYPLDTPLAALMFPGFSLVDKIRFGLVTVYLKYFASWKPLEKHTADSWMRRFYGERLYQTSFEPLLIGKFGKHYQKVNMAWFWARFKARTPQLGSYQGGFQAFAEDAAEVLRNHGVTISLNDAVNLIEKTDDGKLAVHSSSGTEVFDKVLVTLSPGLMAKIAPSLPEDYLNGLLNLKSMGAVVLVLALRRKLSTKGYYWFNMPKTAGFPFLALVEHTNFVPSESFGGDHIVYCGDYLDMDHEYFQMDKAQLLDKFLPSLKRINQQFSEEWLRDSWLFKTKYAQPVPEVHHSRNIPSVKTPIDNLYFASMSQIYPWDRGTNFAVELARETARRMISE